MPSASLQEAFRNLESGLRSHGSSSMLPHWSRSETGGITMFSGLSQRAWKARAGSQRLFTWWEAGQILQSCLKTRALK